VKDRVEITNTSISTITREGALMPSKTVIVGSAVGLHARPAAIISEAVVNAGVPVTLSLDGGDPVDAGSALMIMTLGAGNGASVTVTADDQSVVDSVAALVEQDLDA
jgi:phosphocarrier protein